jgi:hypothetical protein
MPIAFMVREQALLGVNVACEKYQLDASPS